MFRNNNFDVLRTYWSRHCRVNLTRSWHNPACAKLHKARRRLGQVKKCEDAPSVDVFMVFVSEISLRMDAEDAPLNQRPIHRLHFANSLRHPCLACIKRSAVGEQSKPMLPAIVILLLFATSSSFLWIHDFIIHTCIGTSECTPWPNHGKHVARVAPSINSIQRYHTLLRRRWHSGHRG